MACTGAKNSCWEVVVDAAEYRITGGLGSLAEEVGSCFVGLWNH